MRSSIRFTDSAAIACGVGAASNSFSDVGRAHFVERADRDDATDKDVKDAVVPALGEFEHRRLWKGRDRDANAGDHVVEIELPFAFFRNRARPLRRNHRAPLGCDDPLGHPCRPIARARAITPGR